MEKAVAQAKNLMKECPGCGAKVRLYRTPKGLRCAECVKRLDSAGLGFN